MEAQQQGADALIDGDRTGEAKVLDMAFAFWRATLLLSADELGIFAALACGPVDATTLHARLGLDRETASEFLDALVGLGLLERRGDGYCNTPVAARFLDPAQSSYLGQWLAMARAAQWESSDLASRLRAVAPWRCDEELSVSTMWREIAEIVDAGGASGQ